MDFFLEIKVHSCFQKTRNRQYLFSAGVYAYNHVTAGIAGYPDDNPGRGFPPAFSHNPIAAACAGNRYRDLRILAPDYGDDRGADPNPASQYSRKEYRHGRLP